MFAIGDPTEFVFPIGGQWLLDPNELNGWGVLGPYDNVNSQDLGNADDLTPARVAGGVQFPWDVRLKRFRADHYNSNAAAQAWGWAIFHMEKTSGTNVVSSEFILDEVVDNNGVGPRDYSNTTNQLTDITFDDVVVPAGNLVNLSVRSPTAVGTNYYVRILSGYLLFERA